MTQKTLEELDKEFEPFRNDYGFVSDGDLNKDHNPLFHGFYVAIKDRLGLLSRIQIKREKRLLQKLIHPDAPGVLRSAPWEYKNANAHSHDNEKAMFWLSKRLGMPYAADFLKHGRKTGWNYNSDSPREWHPHGQYERFTGMIAQAMIAAGEHPGCFRQTWLYGELFASSYQKRGRTETMTLPYFMCKTIKGFSKQADTAVENWRVKGMQKYPGGLGEVFEGYGPAWHNHPYTKWYAGVIDVWVTKKER